MEKKPTNKHIIWQLSMTAVFFCFGLLLMAQYHTHVAANDSLRNETTTNLAQIIKSQNDNKQALEAELASLTNELETLEASVASGDSLAGSILGRINTLQTALGIEEVKGSGISITITTGSNLIYQDIIDIVNELMNAGAEAVAINGTRFTMHTQIAEEARTLETYNEELDTYDAVEYYAITINGEELLSPIVIKAVGDPQTLETALTYPGGIVSNLNTLYDVYPTIRQASNLVLPAAEVAEFAYAAPAPAAN